MTIITVKRSEIPHSQNGQSRSRQEMSYPRTDSCQCQV